MRLNYIPKIDVYQMTRSNLRVLKIKGSLGGQATSLVEKTKDIATASQGTIDANDHSLTLADSVKNRLNVI